MGTSSMGRGDVKYRDTGGKCKEVIFYLFGIECCYSIYILATATHPTLLRAPIFHQQEDQDSGFTFFNAGGLRPVFVS